MESADWIVKGGGEIRRNEILLLVVPFLFVQSTTGSDLSKWSIWAGSVERGIRNGILAHSTGTFSFLFFSFFLIAVHLFIT